VTHVKFIASLISLTFNCRAILTMLHMVKKKK